MDSLPFRRHQPGVWLLGVIAPSLIALALYFFIKKGDQILRIAFHRDLRHVPGPRISRFTALPLKLQGLTGQRTKYIHSLHETYGPIIRIAPQEISVSDPAVVRQIHKIGTTFQKSIWYKELTYQFDDDNCTVFAIQDPRKASARRKLFQRAATRAAVRQWEPVVLKITQQTVKKIKRDSERGTADIAKWWSMMTADVLTSLAFGQAFHIIDTEQKPRLIKDIEAALVLGGIRLELPWLWSILKYIPLPGLGFPRALFTRLRDYGAIAIGNTRNAASRSGFKTLFSEMLPEDDEKEQPLSDRVIALESTNIIIAGSETTAVALTFLVYAVLKDPALKQQLVGELATCSADPSWDELDKLPFLHGVIQETLRLYAPIPASLRRAVPDEGVVFGKYRIPPNTTVGTQAYTLHRDPGVWKDPEQFDPHRWVDPTAEMKAAFMPFGGAARTCLGQNIARLELLYATSLFFRECPDARISKNTKEKDMEIMDFFAIRPAGGKCEITTRSD